MEDSLKKSVRHPGVDKILTKTMINNYAKNDLLPPPIKKKYSKDHIILLIFIYYYKNILSFSDIQTLFEPLYKRFGNDDADINLKDIYTTIYDEQDEIIAHLKKDIEEKRAMKVIGSSLDAKIVLYCDNDNYDFINGVLDQLSTAFLVSMVELKRNGEGEYKFDSLGMSVDVVKPSGDKCERCWTYSESVGKHQDHPTLCNRCAEVVRNI